MLVAPPASTKNKTGNIVLKCPVTLILSQFCVEHQLVHMVTKKQILNISFVTCKTVTRLSMYLLT